jgi:hypothetical protein
MEIELLKQAQGFHVASLYWHTQYKKFAFFEHAGELRINILRRKYKKLA